MSEAMSKEEWLEMRRLEVEQTTEQIVEAVRKVTAAQTPEAPSQEEIEAGMREQLKNHRRMFACASMQGLIITFPEAYPDEIAEKAFALADSMIKAGQYDSAK